MSDLNIGTRVEPAPVCATPRVATADRHARVVEARRVLLQARSELIEADRALAIMEQGRGGGIAALGRINKASEHMGTVVGLVEQAGS